MYGPSGTIQKLDGLCVLPINVLNEKVKKNGGKFEHEAKTTFYIVFFVDFLHPVAVVAATGPRHSAGADLLVPPYCQQGLQVGACH